MTGMTGLDFGAKYTVDGYRGVAFTLSRYATKTEPVTTLVHVCKHCDRIIEEAADGWDDVDGEGCRHNIVTSSLGSQRYCSTCGMGGCEDVPEHEPSDDGHWVDTGETEEVEDQDWVIAVMVGDDREHHVDVTSLTVLPDDSYCVECGQIGCTADGR